MKKLVVLAAVAIAAAVSQAATCTWKSGTLVPPGMALADLEGGEIMGYLFALSAADYGKITGTDYVWETYGSQLDKATLSKASDDVGAISLKDPATFASGDDAYAAIIYTTTVEGKDYYIANYGTTHFSSSSSKSPGNMGTKLNGSGDALTWQSAGSPVPEPTSGFLLVLGMAGLALRRRRA